MEHETLPSRTEDELRNAMDAEEGRIANVLFCRNEALLTAYRGLTKIRNHAEIHSLKAVEEMAAGVRNEVFAAIVSCDSVQPRDGDPNGINAGKQPS